MVQHVLESEESSRGVAPKVDDARAERAARASLCFGLDVVHVNPPVEFAVHLQAEVSAGLCRLDRDTWGAVADGSCQCGGAL